MPATFYCLVIIVNITFSDNNSYFIHKSPRLSYRVLLMVIVKYEPSLRFQRISVSMAGLNTKQDKLLKIGELLYPVSQFRRLAASRRWNFRARKAFDSSVKKLKGLNEYF